MHGVGQRGVTADQVEDSDPAFVARDCLAIDQAGPDWERSNPFDDQRKAPAWIITFAREQPNGSAVAGGD